MNLRLEEKQMDIIDIFMLIFIAFASGCLYTEISKGDEVN